MLKQKDLPLHFVLPHNTDRMTKAETISKIAERTGIEKDAVEKVIESFFVTIKDSLSEGENVYFRGFGSFTIKHRAQKTARNIALNTTIIVDAHVIPYFKPSPEFVSQIKEGVSLEQ